MQIKVSKEQLLTALEIVKPGLANKELIEQATSFAFMGDRVVTYNDEISISHPVSDMDITGAVKAEELYKLLGKLKGNDVYFEVTDAEVRITAGKARAGIVLQQEIRLPLEELGSISKWKRVPKNLKDALRFTMFSAAKDMSRPVLTCIHVTKNHVESCDNLRLTRYQLETALPIADFLIPAAVVKDLVTYDFVAMAEGEGWVHFKTKAGTVFSSRIFEDEYPNVERLLDVSGEEFQLPAGMDEVLQRAEVFAKRPSVLDEQVVITLSPKTLLVRSEDTTGWFEEELKLEGGGPSEEFEFAINPGSLRDMYSRQPRCELSTERMKFAGDGWEHVVALL